MHPYDAVTYAQVRRIRPRGIWRGAAQGWDFPLAAAQSLQEQLGSRFPVRDDLARWLQWHRHPLPPLPPHRQLVALADLEAPLPDGQAAPAPSALRGALVAGPAWCRARVRP
jgi:hypothetical protein